MRGTGTDAIAMTALLVAALAAAPGCAAPGGAEEVAPAAVESAAPEPTADADPEARALAESVLERMGGRDAWAAARVIRWDFFGRRLLYWDRVTGDVRIDAPTDDGRFVVLLNVDTRDGAVWRDGEPLAGDELAEWLVRGYEIWINDSYWMFMPYKLLDPGVTLRAVGAGETEAGQPARILELTFDGVGVTPENKYRVFVGDESGLVEQWSFFADAADAEPRFTSPWSGWERFGGIMLATDHGRGADWRIAVYTAPPAGVFDDPAWTEAD